MKNPKKSPAGGVKEPISKESVSGGGERPAAESAKTKMTGTGEDPIVNRKEAPEIADTFFTGDMHRKAIDIIDSSSPADEDILSLIGSVDEPSSGGESCMIPELDSILESYGVQESFTDDSLSAHIEPPTLEAEKRQSGPERHEKSAMEEDGRILGILSAKLGVDTSKMTSREKEKFAEEVAHLALTVLEQVRNTGAVLQKVQAQLGVSTFSGTSPLKNASDTREIFANLLSCRPPVSEQIKNLFHDIEKHTIAFHTAYKNLSSKNAEMFAPEKLLSRFKKKGLVKSGFFNKKSQAWEAYCKEFKHLNFVKEDKIDNSELKKEYNRVLDTLSISYNSAKKRAKK